MTPPVLILMMFIPNIIQQTNVHLANIDFSINNINILSHIKVFFLSRLDVFLFGLYEHYKSTLTLRWINRIIVVVLLIWYVSHLIKTKKKYLEKDYLNFAAILLFIIFTGLSVKLSNHFLGFRHTISLFIPLIIFFLQILFRFFKTHSIFSYVIILYIVTNCLINDIKRLDLIVNSHFYRTYSQTIDFIIKNEKANQPIVVFPNEESLILKYYYNGINKIKALPDSIDFSRPYNHHFWKLTSKNQVDSIFKTINDEEGLWLITKNVKTLKTYSVNYNKHLLDDFIDKEFIVLRKKIINDLKIRFLKKRHQIWVKQNTINELTIDKSRTIPTVD
jgi:hypothetical protein